MKSASLLLTLLVPAAAAAAEAGGRVVAVYDTTFVVELEGVEGVGQGSVLEVLRRMPSALGSAAYRRQAVFWEVGRLRVERTEGSTAFATLLGPAARPLPDGLDESGAGADRVQIGDRVRRTEAVAAGPAEALVSFELAALFGPADTALRPEGETTLRRWSRGVQEITGPVEVRVLPRLAELGAVAGPGGRDRTGPLAPRGPELPATAPPPPQELQIVQAGPTGEPTTYEYLDPFTLAARRGRAVASRLAAELGLAEEAVLVTVEPRAPLGGEGAWPGVEAEGDVIRVLAPGLRWVEPPEERTAPRSEAEPAAVPDEPYHRRPLERVPGPDEPVS